MNPAAILLIAMAMSTDAFAAAVGKGIALHRPHWSEALRTGLIFGLIEAATPLLGWAIGSVAASYVQAWDHWIAFTLLGLLGLRMVVTAVRESDTPAAAVKPSRHGFWPLALTGLATSIDALVVGAGLAFVDVGIVPVAAAIGLTTFVAVTCGVMLGRLLGPFAGRWAEAVGGLVLIGIGTAILAQHLGGAA